MPVRFFTRPDDSMRTDEAALYQAILEAPHDDAPRMVYADWQDEFGDATFAAFIRRQVGIGDTGRLLITDEEHDMLEGIGTGTGARSWFRTVTRPIQIVRGFPSIINRFPVEDWETIPGIVANHPVYRVHVYDRVPEPIERRKLFRWNYESQSFTESVVPGPLLAIMSHASGSRGRVPVAFASLDGAFAALSLALLNYGRTKVGLPPLSKQDVL